MIPDSFMYQYYTNKYLNEETLITTAKERGWTWTIIQPATFLSNLLPPWSRFAYPLLATERKIESVFPEDSKQGYLDSKDIGRFAAAALLESHAKRHLVANRRIQLASTNLTLREVVASLNGQLRNWGYSERVDLDQLSDEEVRKRIEAGDLFAAGHTFQSENPNVVDVERVKAYGIELGGMEEFWEREKPRVLESLRLE